MIITKVKMTSLKLIILIWINIILNVINEINAQNSFCQTPSNIPDALSGIYPLTGSSSTYVVRISVHLVRKSNGTGGLNYNQLNSALSYLKNAFEPHGICLSLYKIDEI